MVKDVDKPELRRAWYHKQTQGGDSEKRPVSALCSG